MEYTTLAQEEVVLEAISALKRRNIEGFYVNSGEEALEKIKELIPEGASVMNGSSTTLEQIGYIEYLRYGDHNWENLKANILQEDDQERQTRLRRKSVLSDYYLGSVHALTEDGVMIIASNSGSQLPHIVYTSPNLIFVVSTKKIVPDLEAGMDRLYKHVVPLENEAIREKYGVDTAANKIVIFNGELKTSRRKLRVIFVDEDLGY